MRRSNENEEKGQTKTFEWRMWLILFTLVTIQNIRIQITVQYNILYVIVFDNPFYNKEKCYGKTNTHCNLFSCQTGVENLFRNYIKSFVSFFLYYK